VFVNNHICLHCAACVGACPANSMFLHETFAVEILPTCTECGLCVIVCPVGAIIGRPGQLVETILPPDRGIPGVRP
jgi:NAD-dependent dihydropyrimidine dehydrogenase PreA subunit